MLVVAVIPCAVMAVRSARRPREKLPVVDVMAWDATHVVVVAGGERFDGKVEVLESWAGDLAPGERIDVPGLTVYADSQWRGPLVGPSSSTPVVAGGERMIVFLREGTTRRTWANPIEIWHWAVGFVENGGVYVPDYFGGKSTPWVAPYSSTEESVRARVEDVRAARRAFDEALRAGSPSERNRGLAPFAASDIAPARAAAEARRN